MNNKYLLLLLLILIVLVLLFYLLKKNVLDIKEGNKQCIKECDQGTEEKLCRLEQQTECDKDSFKKKK
jgi:hypothetical protein